MCVVLLHPAVGRSTDMRAGNDGPAGLWSAASRIPYHQRLDSPGMRGAGESGGCAR